MTRDAVRDLIVHILRGDVVAWPGAPDDGWARRFFEVGIDHGVLPLVAHQLHRTGQLDRCPPSLRKALVDQVQQDLLVEEAHDRELRRVLETLATHDLRPLVLKGAALAHTAYPAPHLRPRQDIDLLVAPDTADAVTEVLAHCGYQRWNQIRGDLVMPQMDFLRTDAAGITHTLDVHWRVVNPMVFADVLPPAALTAGAEAVPALGPHARTPSRMHSLVLAGIHRVAHHRRTERLIWLYDIHLLAGMLDDTAWDAFTRLTVDRGVAAICEDGLRQACDTFGTIVPAPVWTRLADRRTEASAVYLKAELSSAGAVASDLRGVASWITRGRLVRQHLFPPAHYMRSRYGVRGRGWLPALYVYRALAGSGRWLRPSTRADASSAR